jgi:hypothetical protein
MYRGAEPRAKSMGPSGYGLEPSASQGADSASSRLPPLSAVDSWWKLLSPDKSHVSPTMGAQSSSLGGSIGVT